MTVAEIIRAGYERSGLADRISWEDLNDKGYYVVSPDPDWRRSRRSDRILRGPREASALHPHRQGGVLLHRPGRALPDDAERPPVPHWIPQGESHQETLGTERSKKYPLLVMSNHPRWGVHSQHDDVTWFREIETARSVV